MRFLRFLKIWWQQPSQSLADREELFPVRTPLARPRVHRKMLPVIRYLEKIHNRHDALRFRYVGPNQMNGDAEELQVFLSSEGQDYDLTIRYLDRLELYFIDGPQNEKLHHTTAREVLACLSLLLAAFIPEEESRNVEHARD